MGEDILITEHSIEKELWSDLISEIVNWSRQLELIEMGKMISKPQTKSQLINELRSRYYLDLISDGKSN